MDTLQDVVPNQYQYLATHGSLLLPGVGAVLGGRGAAGHGRVGLPLHPGLSELRAAAARLQGVPPDLKEVHRAVHPERDVGRPTTRHAHHR